MNDHKLCNVPVSLPQGIEDQYYNVRYVGAIEMWQCKKCGEERHWIEFHHASPEVSLS